MYRLAEKNLDKWFQKKKSKPLLIRGARQIGKTYLVRSFCKTEGIDLFEVNCEKIKIRSSPTDVTGIVSEIEIAINKKITNKHLIFFDEIQDAPDLIQSLRYFYEDRPDLKVIASGSLLEFVLKSHDFSMPVGRVEYLYLSPMTFQEFLLANEKKILVDAINKNPEQNIYKYYKELSRLFKDYLFVGGMPEAVQEYIESKSVLAARDVHKSIMKTYIDDFPKYCKGNRLEKLSRLFEAVPKLLGKKIKFSELLPDERSEVTRELIMLLVKARLLHICFHTNGNGTPIRAQKDEKVFKLYFLDVGLLCYLMRADYDDILSGSLIDGIISEEFIGTHLAYTWQDVYGTEEPELYYWLNDKKSASAELDFVIQKGTAIIPIEVKSGQSGKMKSLIYFMLTHKLKRAIRFDLAERDEDRIREVRSDKMTTLNDSFVGKFELINLPLYAVEFLNLVLHK